MCRATAVLLAVVALAGCGSSSHSASHAAQAPKPHATVCRPAARAAVAHAASVAPDAVAEKAGTSSQATPQCVFRGGKLKVVAMVDSAPQAYFRLERAVVEAEQQFSSVPLPDPKHLDGLGLDAQWFPQQNQLETTDGRRLITVAVSWRGQPLRRQIALAKVTARTYLGPLDRKAADPNGS